MGDGGGAVGGGGGWRKGGGGGVSVTVRPGFEGDGLHGYNTRTKGTAIFVARPSKATKGRAGSSMTSRGLKKKKKKDQLVRR